MDGKVIQIIPAPVNLRAIYPITESEHAMGVPAEYKKRSIPIVCIALTDQGEVVPFVVDEKYKIKPATDKNNFEAFQWGG